MPESQKDYSVFDRMSTEMLEGILRRDFELSDDEESDMDAILYIMDVIAKRKRETKTREYPDAEQAWKSFNEHYRSYEGAGWYEDEDDDSECEAVPLHKPVKKGRPLRRVIGIVAVAAVIIGATSLKTNALGYNFWNVIAQWTSETFAFVSEQDASEDETSSKYKTLQEALDAYGVTEKLAPTWIPEDYDLESIEVTPSSAVNYFEALYQNGNNYIIIKINNVQDDKYSFTEKDDSVVDVFEVDGIKHYIMSNREYNTAAWINSRNECYITVPASCNELKKIIQSIYER